MNHRLGIWVSHPIQYLSPWFRDLAAHLDITVYYGHRQSPAGQSQAGFGVPFDWDIPLLDGYPYQWLSNVAPHPSLKTFTGCDTPEIYQIVQRGRFDAFLVFGWNRKAALQTIWACRQRGIPVLMRGDSQLLTKRSGAKLALKHFSYRWFLPQLDAHLCVGQRNHDYLRHYGVPERRIFFAPHCVDTGFFAAGARQAEFGGRRALIRAGLKIPEDAFVFLFVGKLIARKRPEDFIAACIRLGESAQSRPVHGLLVGDGPLRPALEQAAASAAQRIHFAGFKNQGDLPAYYNAADALVLTSDDSETWGLVVNEAFACDIPALVSDSCGCGPDLIDAGKTGYLYATGDVAQLAERMRATQTWAAQRKIEIHDALAETTRRFSMAAATEGLMVALGRVAAKSGLAQECIVS